MASEKATRQTHTQEMHKALHIHGIIRTIFHFLCHGYLECIFRLCTLIMESPAKRSEIKHIYIIDEYKGFIQNVMKEV